MVNRYLNDLLEVFSNSQGVKDNPLIYSFNNVIPADNSEELLYGITVIQPGDINGEYYMTKGHTHQNTCAEVYFGLTGTGIVLCEKDDEVQEYEISPDVLVYCQPGYAHRVINTSNEPLRFLCVCRADAGHNYEVVFNKKFYEKKVQKDEVQSG